MKKIFNTVLMNTPFGGIDKLRNVYFIGIGGIGMSALARFFHAGGVQVSGYDKTVTPLTQELEAAGIEVHYEEDITKVPANPDLVVYTPAVPAEHAELVWVREQGYEVVKRSDVLQRITESSFTICIAGTHGKTTITTMVAHILRDSGFGCNAFLGGIAVNYGTNFWGSTRNVCVVEADEYDRSFLKLSPDIAVITAMDPDHLDIYGTAESMEEAFIQFGHRLKPGGLLVRQFGLKRGRELGEHALTYSLQNDNAGAYAQNIQMNNGSYFFDVETGGERIENMTLHMGGMHNVENAVAAVTVCSSLGIDKEKIRAAVENFRGVKRRFEYIIKNDRLVFIDDYAHHPEELRALINGAKALFPQRTCTVIFQPHLFSRTRDLAQGFGEALSLADRVILLPIYPARELPLPGVSSGIIADFVAHGNKQVLSKEELLQWVQQDLAVNPDNEFGDLLITAGAGDIDALVAPIKNSLNNV